MATANDTHNDREDGVDTEGGLGTAHEHIEPGIEHGQNLVISQLRRRVTRMDTIATRVRAAMSGRGTLQKDLAATAGVTEDAMSRALAGKRRFASLELARIARKLDVSLDYLITGEEPEVWFAPAARHSFDQVTGNREVTGFPKDEVILEGIRHAYEQAGEAPATSLKHCNAETVRSDLGQEFVRDLVKRLESLEVDVVRINGLSTAYSFRWGARDVIVVPANGNWFRQNWDIAHELGHLCLGHGGVMPSDSKAAKCESDANAFAADLLLPAAEVEAVDWTKVPLADAAEFVWSRGVSTDALERRLSALRLAPSEELRGYLKGTTQKLLRHHWKCVDGGDPITERMTDAAQRRFPEWLTSRHLSLIAEGEVTPQTLAWMLDVGVDGLEVETPPPGSPATDDLMDLLA